MDNIKKIVEPLLTSATSRNFTSDGKVKFKQIEELTNDEELKNHDAIIILTRLTDISKGINVRPLLIYQ